MDERQYTPLPQNVGMVGVLDNDRLVLESIRTKFDGPGVVITSGDLVLETDLKAIGTSVQTIDFEVMAAPSQQFDTEIRLARPDAFTITDVGFYLAYRLVGTVPLLTGADRLLAGPSTDAEALGVTAAMIDAFQSGRLFIQGDSIVYTDQWSLRRCRAVGVAQEGLDPGGGDPYLGNAWGPRTGLARMVPSITLSGAFKLKVQVQLPRPVSLAGVSATIALHAVLRLPGFLSAGGAEFRTATPAV